MGHAGCSAHRAGSGFEADVVVCSLAFPDVLLAHLVLLYSHYLTSLKINHFEKLAVIAFALVSKAVRGSFRIIRRGVHCLVRTPFLLWLNHPLPGGDQCCQGCSTHPILHGSAGNDTR